MTDLATGADRVIGSGLVGYPFRFGSVVVWNQVSTENTTAQPTAVSLATGEPADVPVELRGPTWRPGFVSGDADTVVWSTSESTVLRAWRAGAPDAVTIGVALQGHQIQWPQVRCPLVTWDSGAGQVVADLRSRSFARLTPAFGSTVLSGDALAVTFAPTDPSHPAVLDASLVRPSRLPALPTCG